DAAASYSTLMLGLSFTMCNMLAALFVPDVTDPSMHDLYKTRVLYMCLTGVVVISITTIPTFVVGKETQFVPHGEKGSNNVFTASLVGFKRMPTNLRRICVTFFLSWAGYFLVQISTTNVYADIGFVLNTISALAAVVYSPILSIIMPKVGEKKAYFGAQALGSIAMGLCMIDNNLMVEVCYFFIGVLSTTMNTAPFSLIGKAQTEDSGLYMGIMNMACVLAQAVSDVINTGATALVTKGTWLESFLPIIISFVFSISAAISTLWLEDPRETYGLINSAGSRHGSQLDLVGMEQGDGTYNTETAADMI
ncbi:hypothetical protein KIPB_010570, partial [Kipferlia bialata]